MQRSPPRDATPASQPNVSKHIIPHHHQVTQYALTQLSSRCSVGGAPVKLDLSLFCPVSSNLSPPSIASPRFRTACTPTCCTPGSCGVIHHGSNLIPQPMHAGIFREFFLIFAHTSTFDSFTVDFRLRSSYILSRSLFHFNSVASELYFPLIHGPWRTAVETCTVVKSSKQNKAPTPIATAKYRVLLAYRSLSLRLVARHNRTCRICHTQLPCIP